MSESFSDLWASSNPVKSQQPQQRTLGVAANSPSNIGLRGTTDAFSMLASSGSRPNSRPITPSIKYTPVTSKTDTASGDAFGGLVSFGSSVSKDGGLTIAERAAKAEQDRKMQTEKEKVAYNVQGSFWDKFESVPTGEPSIPDGSGVHVKSNDPWDLDFLTQRQSTEPSRTNNTPWSFEYGGREDQLLGAIDSEDEDDILGSLAKPAEAVNEIISNPLPMVSSSPLISASPPPHVVGRIVEMGFSIQQAKVALAATSNGLDVDAALDILLQNTGTASSGERELEAIEVERTPGQRRGSSRATTLPAHSSSISPQSESPLIDQQGLQEQADKLLTQASMIGKTMFNKANTFWKESREKVGKAYEEQRSSLGKEAGIAKGRPRWMDNARVDEDGNELAVEESQDLQEIRQIPPHPSRPTPDTRRPIPSVSLFANDDQVYKSPARRRSPAMASSSKVLLPPPTSSPIILPSIVRPCIEATPSMLAASSTHKASATEHFKLGRFTEAEAAYTRAIDELPASHLLLIPLYNNRALTRLRTGEYKGTINDSTEVLRIITGDVGNTWHPGREEAMVHDSFGDAVAKALRRRAEAYEGLEKWKDAVRDWERLSTAAWVGHALKGDAIKGAGRCRQMARDGSNPVMFPKVPSKPKPKSQTEFAPAPTSSPSPSEALTRVRAANAALEKEDQARHDLKDVVDARIAAWRNGKEHNLRALIASLDVVLSPTFRWQTVGMSELVSPGQVKVKYTKAIAKLHPDKLNADNTTLEERMVANSVFGTLNEAWNAFR